jgi:L-histidine N-alpha-methyltransferase
MNNNISCISGSITVKSYLESSHHSNIASEITKGLTASQKYLPSKYFYDSRGSQLFEDICRLPEYYLTRTEMTLLREVASEIMSTFRSGDLVELGSGANWKIRTLLEAADRNDLASLRYVPVDVSRSALVSASGELTQIFPELDVLGIIADFFYQIYAIPGSRPKMIIFFGSTIGNLNETESRIFLENIAGSMNPGDRFLLGIDMVKSKERLEAAYNDSKGITSEFNKNILNVINRELNADFNLSHFDHLAFFNEKKERIEMHLKSNRKVSVTISDLDLTVGFTEGETIHTEICRKFSPEKAEQMLSDAGFTINNWYTDSKEWFSLVDLRLR